MHATIIGCWMNFKIHPGRSGRPLAILSMRLCRMPKGGVRSLLWETVNKAFMAGAVVSLDCLRISKNITGIVLLIGIWIFLIGRHKLCSIWSIRSVIYPIRSGGRFFQRLRLTVGSIMRTHPILMVPVMLWSWRLMWTLVPHRMKKRRRAIEAWSR